MDIRFSALIFYLFINSTLLANEVSVFGAGDLESSNPYGLSDSEKVILKNKINLKKFDRKVDDTRANIDLLNERIEGIESIFSGDSKKLDSTVKKLSKMTLKYESSELALENNKKEIEFLKSKIEKLDKTLVLLAKQIDKQYVTKKEFNKLVKFINKQVPDNKQKTRKVKHKKTNKSNKTLLSEAKKLFEKRLFKKSKRIFTKLIEKKYKPAVCNFYLGEIWFFRKKYKDAIYRFKTSMTLYSKANYIPKLLLHSAISFEKTNDLKNARNFYETLIDVYPGTKEAQEAQNKLSQIH